MTRVFSNTFALVAALLITAATFAEAVSVPSYPAERVAPILA